MKNTTPVAWLLCALLIGCASEPPSANTQEPSPAAGPPAVAILPFDASAYRLTAGDSLRIDVLGEAELSLVALVDPIGNITYPFLGQVQAAGQTLRDIERRIQTGLRSGYLKNPDVRVSIAQYRPVYVNGQVRQAGAYPYTMGLTVEKVLTLAGGMTQFGSSRRIYLLRTGTAQDQRQRVELDSPVHPGDTIIVEERLF